MESNWKPDLIVVRKPNKAGDGWVYAVFEDAHDIPDELDGREARIYAARGANGPTVVRREVTLEPA